MDAEDFLTRRETAVAELAELEIEQGRAWLDDKPFDPALIDAKQAEIAAIDRAEAESSRRARAAVAEARAKDRAEARKEARVVIDDHAAAMGRLADHAKAIAVEIRVMQRAAKALSKLSNRLGHRPPSVVQTVEQDHILSRLIAGELIAVGSTAQFGAMSWPGSCSNPDWSDHPRRVAAAFAPLIEGETE